MGVIKNNNLNKALDGFCPNKDILLFNEYFPKYTSKYLPNKSEQKQIFLKRLDTAILFIKELGLHGTIELRKEVKNPALLGDVLANVIINKQDVFLVCKCLFDDKHLIGFVHRFIFRKSNIEGLDSIKNLLVELQKMKFSNRALSNLLIPLNQDKNLWDFLSLLNEEIQQEYWMNFIPNFFSNATDEKILGIEMLLKYKRFISAIDIASLFSNILPSNLLLEVLFKIATEKSIEKERFIGYEINKIFNEINLRLDIDTTTLNNLKAIYFSHSN